MTSIDARSEAFMKFYLVMSKDLAEEVAGQLASDSSVTVEMTAGSEREKEQLRLALADASVVIGVLVGGVKLVETSIAAARAIKAWMNRKDHDKEKIIVRGHHDDAVVTVDNSLSTEDLAAKIEGVVNK
jgi:hypothetical protein